MNKPAFTLIHVVAACLFCSSMSTAIAYKAGINIGAERGHAIGYIEARQDADLAEMQGLRLIQRQRLRTFPEESIGGGYRDGKFVYLKDVSQ